MAMPTPTSATTCGVAVVDGATEDPSFLQLAVASWLLWRDRLEFPGDSRHAGATTWPPVQAKPTSTNQTHPISGARHPGAHHRAKLIVSFIVGIDGQDALTSVGQPIPGRPRGDPVRGEGERDPLPGPDRADARTHAQSLCPRGETKAKSGLVFLARPSRRPTSTKRSPASAPRRAMDMNLQLWVTQESCTYDLPWTVDAGSWIKTFQNPTQPAAMSGGEVDLMQPMHMDSPERTSHSPLRWRKLSDTSYEVHRARAIALLPTTGLLSGPCPLPDSSTEGGR